MRSLSLFASRSVPEHLLRGVLGLGLIGLALWLLALPGLADTAISIAAFAGAVVLLRGCPMCWMTGLFATIAARASARRQDTGLPS